MKNPNWVEILKTLALAASHPAKGDAVGTIRLSEGSMLAEMAAEVERHRNEQEIDTTALIRELVTDIPFTVNASGCECPIYEEKQDCCHFRALRFVTISAARQAEAKLAAISRVRRPTDDEVKAATAKYEAAAEFKR